MPKVSIIILNYNGKRFNKDCLESLLSQSYQDFEIIFVDNASVDSSVEEVELLFGKEIKRKKIQIIRNTHNDGFAEGNNVGVRASHATDYIWLLNNDTIADENALKHLIEGIESNNKIGATGSLVLDNGFEEVIKNEIFNNNNIITSSILGESVLKSFNKKDIIINTQVLSGCSLLYRKHIIDLPFLDFYFAYAEDYYFSWLLLNKGFNLGFCKQSIIYHFGSGSFGKESSEFKLFHGNKNQLLNLFFFFNGFTLIKLFPLILITQGAHLFINKPLKRLSAKLKGITWILKNQEKIKEIKNIINQQKTINEKQFIRLLEPKMTDEIFSGNFSKIQLIIINAVNSFFKFYIKVFF